MIKCRLDESRSFDLSIDMTGVRGAAVPEIRFTIDDGEKMVSIPAKKGRKGGYKINMPCLEGVVPPGTHNAMVEVMLDNKHFVIHREEIWFEEPVRVDIAEMREEAPEDISFNVSLSDSEAPKTVTETVTPHSIKRKGTVTLPL